MCVCVCVYVCVCVCVCVYVCVCVCACGCACMHACTGACLCACILHIVMCEPLLMCTLCVSCLLNCRQHSLLQCTLCVLCFVCSALWRGRHFTKFSLLLFHRLGFCPLEFCWLGSWSCTGISPSPMSRHHSGISPVGILSPLVAAISREAIHTQQVLSHTCTYPQEYFNDPHRQTDVEWHAAEQFCLHWPWVQAMGCDSWNAEDEK